MLLKKEIVASFLWKVCGSKHEGFFEKKKCAPRGWKQRKTFPNAKMDSDVLYDLIKEQSLKHWFGLNVETNPKP